MKILKIATIVVIFLMTFLGTFWTAGAFASPRFELYAHADAEKTHLQVRGHGCWQWEGKSPTVWAWVWKVETRGKRVANNTAAFFPLETATTIFRKNDPKTPWVRSVVDVDMEGCNQSFEGNTEVQFENPGWYWIAFLAQGLRKVEMIYVGYIDARISIWGDDIKLLFAALYDFNPREGTVRIDIANGLISLAGTALFYEDDETGWIVDLGKKEDVFTNGVCQELRSKYPTNAEGDMLLPVSIYGTRNREEALLSSKKMWISSSCPQQE